MPNKQKPWQRKQRGYMRQTNNISKKQRYLIVCEGTVTEVKYFDAFKVPGKVIRAEGTSKNTFQVVEKALRLRKEAEYDKVWCVFDLDDFPPEHFNLALEMAAKHGISVAYSNQSFELWFVLHYEYLNSAIDRAAYLKKLDGHLGFKYQKCEPNMYQILLEDKKMEKAISHAERLLNTYQPSHPAEDDPSTTVHLLVKELYEQAKPMSQKIKEGKAKASEK